MIEILVLLELKVELAKNISEIKTTLETYSYMMKNTEMERVLGIIWADERVWIQRRFRALHLYYSYLGPNRVNLLNLISTSAFLSRIKSCIMARLSNLSVIKPNER